MSRRLKILKLKLLIVNSEFNKQIYPEVKSINLSYHLLQLKQPALFPRAYNYRYYNVIVGPMINISVRN